MSSLDICIQSDYPFVFQWICFSRYARCRCQLVSTSSYTHPSNCLRTVFRHIFEFVKVIAFVIEGGSLWTVGGVRNCTLGFLLPPRDFFFPLIPSYTQIDTSEVEFSHSHVVNSQRSRSVKSKTGKWICICISLSFLEVHFCSLYMPRIEFAQYT